MESSKPESAETDLSKPFRAFLSLFKPRKKPKPQPNLKNQTKSQTIFSDRGYRRKIATEHNISSKQQKRTNRNFPQPTATKKTQLTKQTQPQQETIKPYQKIRSIAITAETITIIIGSLAVVLRKKRHAK